MILFKLTSRSRPDWALRAIESIRRCGVDYKILCTFDTDDPYFKEYSKIKGGDLTCIYGKSENKIHAINRDMDKTFEKPYGLQDWKVLVNVSDDQVFTMDNFGSIILSKFRTMGQDGVEWDTDKFIYFPDGHAPIATMSVMGREYYERDGYIYHPSYKSLWCDNEAHTVAVKRGKIVFCKERIFDHLHPAWGLAEQDDQYKLTEGYYHEDKETFMKRKSNGFA